MATVVEALGEYTQKSKQDLAVFLGGGITDCPDWQAEVIEQLKDVDDLFLLNPRRKKFDVTDPSQSSKQIEWEYHHLRRADAIIFWFCKETLCPITLYELGCWSQRDKPLFIGCDPGYKRKFDVSFQTALCMPGQEIVYDLDDVVADVKIWLKRARKPKSGIFSNYEVLLKMGLPEEKAAKIANEIKENGTFQLPCE